MNISLKHKSRVRLNNVMNNVMCLFCSVMFVYVIKNMISQGDHEREYVLKIGSKYVRKRRGLSPPLCLPSPPRPPRLRGNLVITPQGPGSESFSHHNIRSPCRCTDTLGCSLLVTQQNRRDTACPHRSPPCSRYFPVFFLTSVCSFFPGKSCIVVEG